MVCKHFKSIAEAAVKSNYNGNTYENFYEIQEFFNDPNETEKQYRPFLRAFGHKIGAISLFFTNKFVQRNHWMIQLIKKHGQLISKIQVGQPQYIESIRLDHSNFIIDLNYLTSDMPNLTSLDVCELNVVYKEWTRHN